MAPMIAKEFPTIKKMRRPVAQVRDARRGTDQTIAIAIGTGEKQSIASLICASGIVPSTKSYPFLGERGLHQGLRPEGGWEEAGMEGGLAAGGEELQHLTALLGRSPPR